MKNLIVLFICLFIGSVVFSQEKKYATQLKENFEKSNFKFFINNLDGDTKIDEDAFLKLIKKFRAYVKEDRLKSNMDEGYSYEEGKKYPLAYVRWADPVKNVSEYLIEIRFNPSAESLNIYEIHLINYKNKEETIAFPGGEIDPREIPPAGPPPPPPPPPPNFPPPGK